MNIIILFLILYLVSNTFGYLVPPVFKDFKYTKQSLEYTYDIDSTYFQKKIFKDLNYTTWPNKDMWN
ncbi:hypothetical protein ACTFIY_009839 [Dictyostelium cf. discoideum]